MSTNKEIIIARQLVKKYNGDTAVSGIDFSVYEGECFGIIGPNGAGKTSTIKMIQCFSPVTSGELKVSGYDVSKDEEKIKAMVGVVPQEENLDDDLDVLENLTVYAGYFGIPGKAAQKHSVALLESLQLTNKMHKKIRELSTGMKRRLLVARALINHPRILVLDEPTVGLDPQARRMIWQWIRSLRRDNVTIVLTTHYMEEASQLCDRVAVMSQGRIIAMGLPGELVDIHIGSEVVELYADEINKTELEDVMKGKAASSVLLGDTLYVYYRDGTGITAELERLELKHFLRRPATLEDVYIKLTGQSLGE
jgi:lipooligosaccharide transport system ATP-binding protein